MSMLDLDPADLSTGLGDRLFRVHHHLSEHPLLQTDALAELADFLPARDVQHNLADVPTLLPDGDLTRLPVTPGEVVRSIDTNQCWMVMMHIERHAAYRELLDELLDRVEPLLSDAERPMSRRVGFVFVSAPGAVAPAHIDPEHNLLLQVRGTKTITIGRWDDESQEQQVLERYFVAGRQFVPALPARTESVDLGPGDGVHVPLYAPHWVVNGPAPSIALAITFRTPGLDRSERVHSFNAHLRRLGIDPRPPGRVAAIDVTKAAAIGAWEATRGRRRKRAEQGYAG